MARIDDTIATYLTAIEVERKTPRTIASYAQSLEDFRRVGRRSGLPEAIEEYEVEHVYAFLGDLRRRGAAPGYQNHRHREVRTFFSWCRKMRLVEENVFARVPYAAQEQKIYPPFSRDEARRLLDAQDRSRLKGCREYALILFLLDTGVRVAECLAVRLEDVDWDQGRMLVHGKGQKQRYVGMGERTAEALRDYVIRFRSERAGPLFLTREGHPFADENAIRVILRRVGERASVKNVHPHRFRRTFATWAIESGAHETDVMLLLGHSTLAMTHHYAQTYTSQQALRRHAALSPVAQLGPEDGEGTADGADGADTSADRAPAKGTAVTTTGRPIEDRERDLLSPPSGVSHVVRSEAKDTLPDAPPIREEERMTTTKSAIKAGLTLVAKYKGEQYACKVVESGERLHYVLPDGRAFTSLSAAGKAITGTATNGYRFWSVPDKAPAGQAKRRQAADTAAREQTWTREAKPANGAKGTKPEKLISRAKSQKGVSEGQVRYFCSSCMGAFESENAGRGTAPETCPKGHPAVEAA